MTTILAIGASVLLACAIAAAIIALWLTFATPSPCKVCRGEGVVVVRGEERGCPRCGPIAKRREP